MSELCQPVNGRMAAQFIKQLIRRFVAGGFALVAAQLVCLAAVAAETRSWTEILAAARGQTVQWNAWAGDEANNAFIAWVGAELKRQFAVGINHVKLRETSEAVTRVIAEKGAGRDYGGSIDLIWINGPNFLSMKEQGLLHGPFTHVLPNIDLVDTVHKPSTVVDFTTLVDGLAAPWRMAKLVFVYDSAVTQASELPRSIPAMLAWAKKHPGRFTHPNVSNFLGATFLKQALYELAPDPTVLQKPATKEIFAPAIAPLWDWYDALRPTLWRHGQEFPESGPAQRQLLNDGEIDLSISFNPAEAALSIANKLLPETARVFVLDRGTIGNTSFVAIPYNATNKEGAMIVANFLLEPATQARAQDPKHLGTFSVLDFAKLAPEDQARFAKLSKNPAMPSSEDLGRMLLEPHSSWMTQITVEWEKRYVR
jgi:putative thiamine transport system substrate-binding protein